MKEGQGEIYYATGESRAMLENSPHLEAFRAKGYEVLLLTDPVDEVWVERVAEFDGKPLRSIAKGQVDLETEEERKDTEVAREQQNKEYAELLTFLGGALGDDGQGGPALLPADHLAACIVGDATTSPPPWRRCTGRWARRCPPVKRILELNPTHPLVTGLRDAHQRGADDAGADRDRRAALRHGAARRGRRPGRPGPVRPAARRPAGPYPLIRHGPGRAWMPGRDPSVGDPHPHRGPRRGADDPVDGQPAHLLVPADPGLGGRPNRPVTGPHRPTPMNLWTKATSSPTLPTRTVREPAARPECAGAGGTPRRNAATVRVPTTASGVRSRALWKERTQAVVAG